MKVRVLRELVEGRYQVAFQVDDFTAEEVKKMSQFGTPVVVLRRTVGGANGLFRAQITQIPQAVAAFANEQEAKAYEAEVLDALKTAINGIRERVDDFTSVEEIAF